MKKIRIIIPALLFMMSITSCEKYLDVKKSTDITFIQTTNDCQLVLDNYAVMNINFPSDGEASADDYYMLDNSFLLRSQEEMDFYRWLPGAQRDKADAQYQNAYKAVYYSNLVLENLQKLQGSADQSTLDALRGSALFYRAFTFWCIAQLYARPYSATADTDPGISLRITSDLNDNYPRGTVKQTYDRILTDLKDAVNLLPPLPTVNTRPSKNAAYAMLARTYLSMEDYPNALTNANEALKIKSSLIDFKTLSTTSATPFLVNPSFTNKEVIFHALMSSQTSLFSGTTAFANIAKIVPEVIDSYVTGDLRKTILLKANTPATGPATYRFSGNYEPVNSGILFNGLATDEMYFIRAEAYARAGSTDLAMADLNTLLRTRWTSAFSNLTASNADEALVKIIAERRKGLLMRGLRWTDLRRLNHEPRFQKTITRIVTVSGVSTVYTLPPNDLRYVLLLPKDVISRAGVAQNPR